MTRDRDVPWWKPQSSRRPSDFRRLCVESLPISGNQELGTRDFLTTRDRDVPWWKPRSSRGPSDLRRLHVARLPVSGNWE
jgi:hypothetical protein